MENLPTLLFLYDIERTERAYTKFSELNGYAYSRIMRKAKISVFSENPFEVIKECDENFAYGYTHIKINGTNYIV